MTDLAGNSASLTVRYSVPFASAGVLPPLSPTKTSLVSGGSVPVTFQLLDAAGQFVGDLTQVLHLAKLTDGVWGTEFDPTSTSMPKNGTAFRYDAKAKQYVYNLNTKVLAAGTYRLRIDLGHGGEMFAQIQVR